MTAAQHVRVVLEQHRKNGASFEKAWVSALRSLPKGSGYRPQQEIRNWKLALQWAKPAFRAAYLGQQMPPDAEAAAVLIEGGAAELELAA